MIYDPIGGIILIWILSRLFTNRVEQNPHNTMQEIEALAHERHFPEAEKKLRKLVRQTEREQGVDGIGVAVYVRRLAQLMLQFDDKAAAETQFRRVLDIQEKNLGPVSDDIVPTLGSLAFLAEQRHDLEETTRNWKRAVYIRTCLHGEDDPELASILNMLGLAAYQQQKLDDAISYFREALRIADKNTAGENTLWVRVHNLAFLLFQAGKLDEAEGLFRRALEMVERTAGPSDANWVYTLLTLAELLERKGDERGAELLYRKGLEGMEKTFGADDVKLVGLLVELGRLLGDNYQLTEAEPLLRRALAIQQKQQDATPLALLNAISPLAKVLVMKGSFEEALALDRRALAISEKELGAEHGTSCIILGRIGHELRGRGELTESAAQLRLAIERAEKSNDQGAAPFIAATLFDLGALLKQKDDVAGAEEVLWRSLTLAEKGFGPESLQVALTLEGLAELRAAKSNFESSENLLRRALQMKEKLLSPTNPDIAHTLINVAALVEKRRDFGEAESHLRRALLIYQNLGDREHVAETIHRIAILLYTQGRLADAELECRRALDVSERNNPEGHATGAILSWMGAILEAKGDFTGARMLLARSYEIAAKNLGPDDASTIEVKSRLDRLLHMAAASSMN